MQIERRTVPPGGALPSGDLPHLADLPAPDAAGEWLDQLGGPPTGADARARDLDTVHDLHARRTSERDAWAQQMARRGHAQLWRDLATRLDASNPVADGRTAAQLVEVAITVAARASDVAKARHDRPRPFEVDPRIVPPVVLPTNSSFPSGHAAAAYAAAAALGRMHPHVRDDAFALARDVATSRVYAGVHFPSDVAAGARLGLASAAHVAAMPEVSDPLEALRRLDLPLAEPGERAA